MSRGGRVLRGGVLWVAGSVEGIERKYVEVRC